MQRGDIQFGSTQIFFHPCGSGGDGEGFVADPVDGFGGGGGKSFVGFATDEFSVGAFQFLEQLGIVDCNGEMVNHRLQGLNIVFVEGVSLDALDSDRAETG